METMKELAKLTEQQSKLDELESMLEKADTVSDDWKTSQMGRIRELRSGITELKAIIDEYDKLEAAVRRLAKSQEEGVDLNGSASAS
jgi:predicted component of type VI protein secretion system